MNLEDKKFIYESFKSGDLYTKSVSKDKKIEWKRVLDVQQHYVYDKDQYKVMTNNKSVITTGDHSLYKYFKNNIEETFVRNNKIGDILAIVDDEKILGAIISSILLIPSEKYMYDLSVEDNHNFVLTSGIIAHNTFRPPESEKFIQGQTQVFGFIWEDEELYEFLVMAIDDFNSRPPTTSIDFGNLFGSEKRWTTTVLIRAAAFACFAIALTWIANEFNYSISGVSLDIEKSSKYQAMKDEFIGEYDKLVEQNKLSIKLIKGLRQFKYGVGISSALGLSSRPGVQSRANLIAAGQGWY